MGLKKQFSYLHGGIVYKKLDYSIYNEDELMYHSSWEWLMPVCQEIFYRYQDEDFDKELKKNPYDKKHIYNSCVSFFDKIGL